MFWHRKLVMWSVVGSAWVKAWRLVTMAVIMASILFRVSSVA